MPVNSSSLRSSLIETPLSSAVELPWQARPIRPPASARRGPGLARNGSQRRLLGGAGRVVVAEGGVELLLLVGVAKAEGEGELVGDVEDVVGEQRPVAAVLVIAVERAAAVVDPVRAGRRRRGSSAPAGRRRRDPRRQRAADHGTPGRADAARSGRRVEAGEAGAGDEPAGGEAAILGAEAEIVGDLSGPRRRNSRRPASRACR